MRRSMVSLTAIVTLLGVAGCTREAGNDNTPPRPSAGGQQQGGGLGGGQGGGGGQADAGAQDAGQEGTAPQPGDEVAECLAGAATAEAVLKSHENDRIEGTLYLIETAGGTLITGSVRGLPPGEHGIHIHEVGDCSAPDFTSAGEHWNPTGARHDAPFAGTKHAGDLGNLITNEKGVADFGMRISNVTLDRGPRSLVNRAVVVHLQADDYKTQPAGAAGARIACGVILPRGGEQGGAEQGQPQSGPRPEKPGK